MLHHPPSLDKPAADWRRAAARLTTLLRRIGIPLLALCLLLAAVDMAEARRVGGGKSFGSRDTYSRPYDKPAAPNRNTTNMDQQPAPANPGSQTAPGAPAARPGMFGGMGGMFGGLLMGGLIGSMLSGGGLGGGFGILEMLLLFGGVYLLFRLFAGRKAAPTRQTASGGERFAYATGPGGAPDTDRTPDGWGALHATPPDQDRSDAASRPVMPAGLDEAEFLAGVKALYARLQASWDRRDLDDIRQFTSPEVFSEIARQAEEDPTPGRTDILMVEARVLEAASHGGQTVITVFFDVLLREDQSAGNPGQVREVWRISRDEKAARPSWTLEGIQQLAM
ncbi:Tim44 domain-containing protein [Desulfovibrio sulfodismutans]|uniref:Tim44 domain-containing protein n=1 Tax=Desulfolutivibrio sulfodismutans TaxID=63561 RepID=A0A7K3NHP2_9BACT|nr:Tim44-like domain-containing protein [Desulfolutivibrio sulfodismutans]NDY55607.1 Tim44 domain-containing protein [Desulfolutivibrio sulfodismutans]QLA11691.1 Tim44 domain-containing protein [Desulfolutivibrio sulfodismutans DSM 3696]